MRVTLAGCCLLSAVLGAGTASALDDAAPTPLPGATNSPPPGNPAETLPALSVVVVELNGQRLDHPIFVATLADELFLPRDLIDDRRLEQSTQTQEIGGRQFVSASALNAEQISFDRREGLIRIRCTAGCFSETLVSAMPGNDVELSPVAPGVFLNYDIFAQAGDLRDRAGALMEMGYFSGNGTGTANIACTGGDIDGRCVRLDTAWTVDTPASARRLSIGDTVTGAAGWGTPVRFGGIRLGTDFSLRPDEITFPTPSISSEAALPGLVDVIINDAERFSTDVPAGPFTLSDLPVITGAGTAQLVMTDVLGRESVVTADYYAAPQLLRPDLEQWSLEAGFLRQDYGLRSNEYGDGFLAAAYARGLTDRFTLGGRSELAADQQSAGISGAFLNPEAGVFQASAAMSTGDRGTGSFFDLRHEWKSPSFSLGSSVSYATEQYRQFGRERETPRLTARTFASYSDDRLGVVSFSWTHRDERDVDDFSTLGLRYTQTIGPVSLNVSALRFLGANDTTVAALSLSIPLGGGANSNMGVDYRNGKVGGDLRYQRNAPSTGGVGYYGRVAVDGYERYEAGTDVRTRFGDASAAFSQVDGRSAGRMSLRGGAALVAGTWVAAPSITDSIAVVSVGDEPGVHVYQDRQPMGVTDKHGRIVLTRLRPFERNTISFDPRDVSLNRTFDTTETIVVPGLRTGHQVKFANSETRGVIAYIVDTDGVPISGDGRIANVRSGEVYPIGQDGRVYIADAGAVTRLKFVRNRVICEAEIRLAPTGSDAPYEDAGRVECLPLTSLR